MPKELDAVSREVEHLVRQVREASRKKKQPPNLENAKNYIVYMAQVWLIKGEVWHRYG